MNSRDEKLRDQLIEAMLAACDGECRGKAMDETYGVISYSFYKGALYLEWLYLGEYTYVDIALSETPNYRLSIFLQRLRDERQLLQHVSLFRRSISRRKTAIKVWQELCRRLNSTKVRKRTIMLELLEHDIHDGQWFRESRTILRILDRLEAKREVLQDLSVLEARDR